MCKRQLTVDPQVTLFGKSVAVGQWAGQTFHPEKAFMIWVLPLSWKTKHGRSLIPGFVVSFSLAIAGIDIAGVQGITEILTKHGLGMTSNILVMIPSLPRSFRCHLVKVGLLRSQHPHLRRIRCMDGFTQPSNKPTKCPRDHPRSFATASA